MDPLEHDRPVPHDGAARVPGRLAVVRRPDHRPWRRQEAGDHLHRWRQQRRGLPGPVAQGEWRGLGQGLGLVGRRVRQWWNHGVRPRYRRGGLGDRAGAAKPRYGSGVKSVSVDLGGGYNGCALLINFSNYMLFGPGSLHIIKKPRICRQLAYEARGS